MEIIGKQLEIGFSVEETRGTAKAAADKWVKNISANVIEKAEHVQDESVRGVFEDMDGRRVVKTSIEGDAELPVYADEFGYLALNIYGAVQSTLVATGVYDHVFSLAQSSIAPSLTIYAKDGSVQQSAFRNGHINTLEINSVQDDYVKATVGFIAKDAVANTDTPSYDTAYDFIGRDVTVKVADSEAGLAGATPICVKELNITFDRGLISDFCLGSYTPSEILASKMSIEGSLTKNFEDEVFKDMFLGNSAKYMQISIEGEATIGAASKPSIKILLNKVMISNWERSGGRDETVVENVEFKAFYNATDEEQSTMTIRNVTAEYISEDSE